MGKKGKLFIGLFAVSFAVGVASLYLNHRTATVTSKSDKVITQKEQEPESPKPLYLGFIPNSNAVIMVRRWQPLADYLTNELGMPVELVFRSSYRAIITALTKGEIDVCLTGAFVYVLTRQETDIRPLVRRKKYGKYIYHSIVVVRKDSKINTIEDLQGKKFAFTDRESTTGYLLPVAMMKKRGIPEPEKYFSEVIFTGNHDSALLAVYTRSTDGAAVATTYYRPENLKVKELKIIWKSQLVPMGPFSARGVLDKRLAERIKKAFLKIGKTPDTKALSDHIQIEGFKEANDSDYDVIRKARKWVY